MADASEEFRRVFTGALEEESGLELAAETGDGQETVRLAKELSPDIVVMDFVLARMDGLEVLSELAALPGRPRVLVLSSFARGNMAHLFQDGPHAMGLADRESARDEAHYNAHAAAWHPLCIDWLKGRG